MRYSKYPSYHDSGVEWLGEVPEHWRLATVSRLFDIKAGGDVKKEYFSEEQSDEYPYPIYTNSTKEAAVYGYSKKAFFHENTITVSGRGYIGYAIYREHKYDAIIRLLVLSPRNKRPCKFFMYYINDVLDFQVANTAISQLSTEQISPYQLVLPPLQEQQTIANFLDKATSKIDTLIEKQTKLITLLKEKRQAVISTAVTRGLDETVAMKDSEVEWLGEIPEHWEVPKIGFIGYVINGSTPSKNNKEYWTNGSIPWLASGCLNIDKVIEPTSLISLDAYNNCSVQLIPSGSLLVGMVGQGKTRGTSALLGIDACINQNLAAIIPSNRINIVFLHFLFQTMYVSLRESGRGSNQAALNCDIINSILIPLPLIQEQKNIVNFVNIKISKIDTLIKKSTQAITLLKEKRTALISAVVTGKIDVRGTLS